MKQPMDMFEIFKTVGGDIRNPQKLKNCLKD